MDKPLLTVIAGCNGAGKSSFANALSPKDVESFDYDKEFLRIYSSKPDSEYRETISHNLARQTLEESINKAILSNANYTYETNFNSSPLYWPEKFKDAGYRLILFFFCLDSINEAKRRVQIRVENGGHFVSEWEIEKRYHEGYLNLNNHWDYFHEVHLFNTSEYGRKPKHVLSLVDGKLSMLSSLPEFLLKKVTKLPLDQS